MTTTDILPTNPTLFDQLRQDPTDQRAWGRFVDQYGPRIYYWCRQWRLQDADAEDVTQNVLAKLAEKMRFFQYDPARRFRGWLKTLAHHAWRDFLDSQRRSGQGSGSPALEAVLDGMAARADLVQRLEEAFDHELLDQAIVRVRSRVRRHTWEAFRLTALEGLSGAEAAERLQMKVAHVFVAKSEVQKMLKEEVHQLERRGDRTPGGLGLARCLKELSLPD
jgi:RNA polymerase sigma-70 factor (ECF subfamily)